MSTVVVDELITTLDQPISVFRPISLAAIKPYIFAASPLIESITFSILKDGVALFTQSHLFEDLKAALNTSDDNFHGFFPFYTEGTIYLPPGDYVIRMSASGYTFSSTNFVGWCKDYLRYFGKITGEIPTHYSMFPYSFRLLEYSSREK